MESTPRRILITGATRGLGRALALRLAGLGHVIEGCGSNADTVARVGARLGQRGRMERVDISSDQEVAAWGRSVLERIGAPDLILNNAALINSSAPLWEVPGGEIDRVVDVNIKGIVHVIRHFLPPMLAARKGVIVNFSSGWGRSTSPRVAPYCATKWAVEGLTLALSQELPAPLAAVSLNPGVIHTEMLESCVGAREAASHPGPESWAEGAALLLLSLGRNDNGRQMDVASR